MRVLLVIVALVVIAWVVDWAKVKGKEESKRLAEQPRSEKFIAGSLDRGKAGAAAIQVHDYSQSFMQFKLTKNRNPTSLKELVDEGYLPGGNQFDAFGQPYELVYEGREAVISSPGPDRVRGTPDDLIKRFVVD